MPEPGPSWYIDLAVRRVFSITTGSVMMQLVRHAWANASADSRLIAHWRDQLLGALRSGRSEGLCAETLSVLVAPESVIEVPVSLLNTQLFAADWTLPNFSRGYEPEVLAAIDGFLPDDGVFFDIGANWGTFSIATALRPNFRGTVHGFEAMPRPANDFRKIVGAIPRRLDLHIHQMGLSNRAYTAKVPEALASGGSSLLNDISSGDRSAKPVSDAQGEVVEVRPLDGLDLPLPQVMKIDVEGSEVEVIEGGEQVIRQARPVIIFENWLTQDDMMRMMEPFLRLTAFGYKFYHAGWVDNTGRIQAVPDPARLLQRYVLSPFAPEDRLRVRENVNFFAVHQDHDFAGWTRLADDPGPWYYVR